MALPESPIKSDFAKGLFLGLAAAAALPLLLPLATNLRRPLLRAATRAGLVLYERTRDTLAELTEVVDDFAAEARADLERAGHRDDESEEVEHTASGADAEEPPESKAGGGFEAGTTAATDELVEVDPEAAGERAGPAPDPARRRA